MSSITNYGVHHEQLSNTQRWLCFASLFLFGFTTSFNLFKASPAMAIIGADLGLGAAELGNIMTFYSIAALVLAFPGALIMRKIGVKASVVFSGCLMVIGTAISSFCGDNDIVFMTGRAIEGCAYGLICVIGPNILPRLFPRKQMGLAVGIWSQWIACGTIIAFFVAPAIFSAAGDSWHAIWYFSLGLGIVALLLMLILVKMPAINENELVAGDVTVKANVGKQFMLPAIMVSVAFTFWVFIYVDNINGMYPTFLQEVKGMSMFDSSMLPNWIALITVPLGIAAGVIAGRTHTRKWLIAIPYAIVAVILFFCAFTPGDDVAGPWIFCIVMGICASFIPTCTRAIIPILVTDPFKTDMALAVMAFVTGVAQVCATLASFSIAEIGWTANGQFVLAPLALLAAIIVAVFVKSDRSVGKLREEEDEAARKAAK